MIPYLLATMPSTSISFHEADVIKLVLEFLTNRDLNISMLSLERETGVINGMFSDDMLFLRQLILDGRWDDVIDFVQPLSSIDIFNMKLFQYIVYRHKYLELLCIRSESAPAPSYDYTVDEVVKCLNTLEQLCPAKDEYNNLCLLLTLSRLSDHPEYLNWNPSNARVQCFAEVYPLVEKLLPVDKRDKKSESRLQMARDDRLIQLIVKGMLYESCVEYCQHKATSPEYEVKDLKIASMLSGTGFSDTDVSLLSWLQAIPHDIFACPFAQKSLKLDVRPLEKPSLEASWTEQILTTPIKPKMFPHSAMPASRKSLDFMSQSLIPQYDGLSCGLASGRRDSTGGHMSKSFAGFHLNVGAKRLMQTSVDKLFEEGEAVETGEMPRFLEEPTGLQSKSSPLSSHPAPSSRPAPQSPRGSSGLISKQAESVSTLLDNSKVSAGQLQEVSTGFRRSSVESVTEENSSTRDSSSDLYKQYQKQRQRVEEDLARREKQRLVYKQQILEADEYCALVKDGAVDASDSTQNVAGDESDKGRYLYTYERLN